jgi:hypothetical protein
MFNTQLSYPHSATSLERTDEPHQGGVACGRIRIPIPMTTSASGVPAISSSYLVSLSSFPYHGGLWRFGARCVVDWWFPYSPSIRPVINTLLCLCLLRFLGHSSRQCVDFSEDVRRQVSESCGGGGASGVMTRPLRLYKGVRRAGFRVGVGSRSGIIQLILTVISHR